MGWKKTEIVIEYVCSLCGYVLVPEVHGEWLVVQNSGTCPQCGANTNVVVKEELKDG